MIQLSPLRLTFGGGGGEISFGPYSCTRALTRSLVRPRATLDCRALMTSSASMVCGYLGSFARLSFDTMCCCLPMLEVANQRWNPVTIADGRKKEAGTGGAIRLIPRLRIERARQSGPAQKWGAKTDCQGVSSWRRQQTRIEHARHTSGRIS